MYYGDKRESCVNIADALRVKGWNIYGYSEDQSDSMTDYYCPASWDGIAEKNGFVLCVDNKYHMNYSGYEVYGYTQEATFINNDKIQKLQALANDKAATEGEKENALLMIEKLKNKYIEDQDGREKTKVLKYKYPEFQENPTGCNWHVEKNGKIYLKGKGAFQFHDLPYYYNIWTGEFSSKTWADGSIKKLTDNEKKAVEKFKNFIIKIDNIALGVANMGDGTEETEEAALEQEAKQGYEKITATETKTVTKPVKVDRKTIQEGDILTFAGNYAHGGFWQVIEIWENNNGIKCYTYELLGSEKRGFQRVKNTKRYYQKENAIIKGIEAGTIIINEMKTFNESKEVEKWVKIDQTKKTNNTKKQTETQKPTENKQAENIKHEYTITADTDTRDNSPLWVVKIIDKLSKEEYITVSEQFKKIKGYYSKFKHGFIFKYDPTEVLNGDTITEQPNKVEETAGNLLDNSINIMENLGLNHETYSTNEEYKRAIAEYLLTNKIGITAGLLEYLTKEGYNKLVEILNTIKAEAEQKIKQEQQQAEKTSLLEKIEKNIESLQRKIDALSGDYKTNTYKRMKEQEGRDRKKESLEIDIKLLEYVKEKLIDNIPITALEKALIVGAFRDEIHQYYVRKYGRHSQEVKFPEVDYTLPVDGWWNKEVPQRQNKLKRYGITNTYELLNAIEEYKVIYNSIDRYVSPIEQKIKKLSNEYKLQQKGDINFTPGNVVDQLIEYAQIDDNSIVLEPSAGIGNIADKVKEITNNIDVCEQMYSFCELLKMKGFNVVGDDFLQCDNYNYYNTIIMNPPFSAEQEHIKHAYNLLKTGGKIVAITSPSWTFNSNRKSEEFRNWFYKIGGEIVEELKSGTFEMTGVSSKIVVIEKHEETMKQAI